MSPVRAMADTGQINEPESAMNEISADQELDAETAAIEADIASIKCYVICIQYIHLKHMICV